MTRTPTALPPALTKPLRQGTSAPLFDSDWRGNQSTFRFSIGLTDANTMSDLHTLKLELDELLSRADQLRRRIAEEESRPRASENWPPEIFYADYHATTGFLLGGIAALVSLGANIVGAPLTGRAPLELIRVYLTFPFGERALQLSTGAENVYAVPDGLILTFGCCLYLGTGMVIGVPLFVAIMKLAGHRSTSARLIVATVMGLLIWFVNFHLILNWLQPWLLGGRWITDPAVLPHWVAAVTHLIFGWTLALLAPWGRFQPYAAPASTP